jgi:O-antigen/teichoic acid export membrane protein
MTHKINPYGHAAVRVGIVTFLAGRGFSAVLTFTAFALAARLLSLPEYGIYAAALALMEIGLALSSAGVDWVAARTLPDYRVHAGGPATVSMVLRLGTIQSLILFAAGGLVAVGAGLLARMLYLQGAEDAFLLAGALLAVEGVGRLSRDQMLGILMHQRSGQVAQVIRAGTLAAQLALALHSGVAHDARDVLRFELIAAISAAIAGAVLLAHVLWRLWPLAPSNPLWRPPASRQLMHLALHTYTNYLLALAYGPQVLTMLIARLLGVDAVAIFGFARGFADQVRRYLPTDLLQSVIRPALVAYYSASNDFPGLMLRLGLWLKSSLIILLPLLVFFCVFGEMGSTVLGGERFRTAWPVVVLLLCGAGMMAWRRVVELASYTVMEPDICVRAGVVLVLVPPVMAGLLALTGSLLLAVALAVVAEAVFCLRVLQMLRQRSFSYVMLQGGFMRLLFALILSIAILGLMRGVFAPHLMAAATTTLVVCLLVMRVMRPLSADEDALVAGWSPRLAQMAGCNSGAVR